MSSTFNVDTAISLAPDAVSAIAASALAVSHKWLNLCAHGHIISGECPGSGKHPYQTVVDTSEPAFQCSCPSRKLPCKHSVGLLILYVKESDRFQPTETMPTWAADWIEKQANKSSRSDNAGTDTAPSRNLQRAQQREANVAAGLLELRVWLADLIRHGLAEIPARGNAYWEEMAARMVDAQAPGVARMLRSMEVIPSTGDGWPRRLLRRIASLQLLIESFEHRESLPINTLWDVKTTLGWTVTQDDLRSVSADFDEWAVVGQRFLEEDRLKVRRTWLAGKKTRKTALLLHYAHGSSSFDIPLSTGMTLEGELTFYPGATPLRAALGRYKVEHETEARFHKLATISESIDSYAETMSMNPWIEIFPITVEGVVPTKMNSAWILTDSKGSSLRLATEFSSIWSLLALSGGHPVDLFGEWDGENFYPMSGVEEGSVVPL